jgi:hypothetical protein
MEPVLGGTGSTMFKKKPESSVPQRAAGRILRKN